MLTTDPRAHWQRFGETEPYWAVLTEERFRGPRLSAESLDAFFETGERFIAELFQSIESTIAPGFHPRDALDFGCGVGRLTLPIARRAGRVVGVDVSGSMLDLARAHASSHGITNVELMQPTGEASLEALPSFDFIHSFIVFQHIPVRSGLAMLRILLSKLRPGGVAAIHITERDSRARVRRLAGQLRARVPLVNPLLNVLRGRPAGTPHMQTNLYRRGRVVELFRAAGLGPVTTVPVRHGALEGVILIARKEGSR